MKAAAVWVAGLALNCLAVGVAGPGAIIATFGGALVAVGALSLGSLR